MRLVSAYEVVSNSILYRLLEERLPSASISHQEMPTWKEHKKFVRNHPYTAWYLIMEASETYGSIYLTPDDEIGIFLFKKYQGKGYAKQAIEMLMKLHPRKQYLANINPNNEGSIRMFARLGFTHIQNTYKFDA